MMRGEMFVIFLIPIVAIIGGFAVAIAGIWHKSKLRQLAYQERIAMIQRGMVPPPETHPSAMDYGWHSSPDQSPGEVIHGVVAAMKEAQGGPSAERYGVMYHDVARGAKFVTAGIVVMGIGFGLMMIITFAGGEAEAGLGVGGGIAALGAALLVCGIVENRRRPFSGFGPPPPLVPRPDQHSTGAGAAAGPSTPA